MRQLLGGDNLAFCLSRGAESIRGWEHIFCTRALVQHHTVSLKEVNYVFPLDVRIEEGTLAFGSTGSVNFATQFLNALADRLTLGTESALSIQCQFAAEIEFTSSRGQQGMIDNQLITGTAGIQRDAIPCFGQFRAYRLRPLIRTQGNLAFQMRRAQGLV